MGHEVKVENISTTFESIEFCQSHPVWVGHKWRFIRNPWKVLSHCNTGQGPWFNAADRMTKTVGQAELALSGGVPILQSMARTLIRLGGDAKLLDLEVDFMTRVHKECRDWTAAHTFNITAETRLSFYLAFNIHPTLQIAMETELENIDIDVRTQASKLPPFYTEGMFYSNVPHTLTRAQRVK
jgi:hypothetical protein